MITFNTLFNKLKIQCIRYLLKNTKHYNRISSAGPNDGASFYDTYWVRLEKYREPDNKMGQGISESKRKRVEKKLEDARLVIFDPEARSKRGGLLYGKYAETSEDDVPPKQLLTLSVLDEYSINIRHFYLGYVFEYNSYIRPVLERTLRIYKLRAYWDRIGDWCFRRRFKIINDRLNILKAIVKLNDQSKRSGISHLDLCRFLYGDRMFSLPSKERNDLYDKTQRLLYSLQSLEAILDNGHGYRYTGKGLNLIFEWEREFRKDKSEVVHRRAIVFLTFILATTSYFSVWFQYCGANQAPFPDSLSFFFQGCEITDGASPSIQPHNPPG